MATILYLHGFLSSPQSSKARATKQWLAEHAPQTRFVCPQLASYPAQAIKQILTLFDDVTDDKVGVIGSSLGGFWATYLVENNFVDRAVLVNPAVMPHARIGEFIDKEIQHYYLDETVKLTPEDLCDLQELDFPVIARPSSYWLMVQTADETLDYRLAVEKYLQSEQLIEEGGNHRFENYEQWLPEIYKFLEMP